MTLQPVAAVPVDADLWWIVYLRGALVGRAEPYAQTVYFDRRVPSIRRDRMCIVRRDGGSISGLFDQPRIALDVWVRDDDDAKADRWATDLSRLLIALALRAPGLVTDVTRVVHASGPNSVPDPSNVPRRLSLIEATHRAAVLTT